MLGGSHYVTDPAEGIFIVVKIVHHVSSRINVGGVGLTTIFGEDFADLFGIFFSDSFALDIEVRASKLDKLNVGISNLEVLTSKLKQSFGDDAPASDEAVQAKADIHQSNQLAPSETKKEQKAIDQSIPNSKIK